MYVPAKTLNEMFKIVDVKSTQPIPQLVVHFGQMNLGTNTKQHLTECLNIFTLDLKLLGLKYLKTKSKLLFI